MITSQNVCHSFRIVASDFISFQFQGCRLLPLRRPRPVTTLHLNPGRAQKKDDPISSRSTPGARRGVKLNDTSPILPCPCKKVNISLALPVFVRGVVRRVRPLGDRRSAAALHVADAPASQGNTRPAAISSRAARENKLARAGRRTRESAAPSCDVPSPFVHRARFDVNRPPHSGCHTPGRAARQRARHDQRKRKWSNGRLPSSHKTLAGHAEHDAKPTRPPSTGRASGTQRLITLTNAATKRAGTQRQRRPAPGLSAPARLQGSNRKSCRNGLGQVVGEAVTAAGAAHAFLYGNRAMTDLGTLGGSYSVANRINDGGTIVGSSNTSDGNLHAFLYSNRAMTDLGTFGGSQSIAYGINGSGQVVGGADTTSGSEHAFLYSNGTMTDLGTFGSDNGADQLWRDCRVRHQGGARAVVRGPAPRRRYHLARVRLAKTSLIVPRSQAAFNPGTGQKRG